MSGLVEPFGAGCCNRALQSHDDFEIIVTCSIWPSRPVCFHARAPAAPGHIRLSRGHLREKESGHMATTTITAAVHTRLAEGELPRRRDGGDHA